MDSEGLHPELDEAQKALITALEEACAADLTSLDTPELIRIGKSLDAASKAAREAVAMRLQVDSSPGRRDALQESSDRLPVGDAAPSTPHRVFDDSRGKRWHAFAVQAAKTVSGRASLPASFHNGWLVFDSPDEVRRVAPIPDRWMELSTDQLRRLCEKTVSSPKRIGATGTLHQPDSAIRK